MKRLTITLNEGPQMDILGMHINNARKYIEENNLTIIKVEEHLKDPKNASGTILTEITKEEAGL